MFCHYCHFEFYVPEDTLGATIRCPNCTGSLRVEDMNLLYPCPECGGMLNVSLWMVGSVSSCPHCNKEITLSLGEDSCKYFPDESEKQRSIVRAASHKAGDIIGKYRVVRCLGIGGMGEVYLVEHTLLNNRCALKLLKPEIARQDPEMRARLLREARLASQIQHPNLIAVLDAELDENSDSCYIVMEYVDGVSIENILVDGPMMEQRTLEIITCVAEALREAAEHKIIHRDIKPANIMLSSTGDVKLADLGIAKVESDNKQNVTLTMDNAVLGTPNYASPEQLRSSHKVDSRADIYSLGATMYHMLTGKRPFEAESVFGVMANVLEKDIPPAKSVNPGISASTSALIEKMMSKKRDERPANFEILLKELKSGRKKFRFPILKFKKMISLRNIWSLFLGIVAVAGLCVAGKILYLYDKERKESPEYQYQERLKEKAGKQTSFTRTYQPVVYSGIKRTYNNSAGSDSNSNANTRASVDTAKSTQRRGTAFLSAIDNFDIRTVKQMKGRVIDNQQEAALKFVRAALRMDYLRCVNIARTIEEKYAVRGVMDDNCRKVKNFWIAALNGYLSTNYNTGFGYEEQVWQLLGYIKFAGIMDDVQINEKIQKIKEILSKNSHNKTGFMKSSIGIKMSRAPWLIRRDIRQGNLKEYTDGKILDSIRAPSRYFYRGRLFASLVYLLDAGYPVDDVLKNKLSACPQFDDFTDGSSNPAYDYSMMDVPDSYIDDLKRSVGIPVGTPVPVASASGDETSPPAVQSTEEKRNTQAAAAPVEIDFSNLDNDRKDEFISTFLSDGVINIDGLYPYSAVFRDKHGSNAKKNRIMLDNEPGDEFTVSMVFYPQSEKSNYPLLSVRRNAVSMRVSNGDLAIVLNFSKFFRTGMIVDMNQWNFVQLSVSVEKKTLFVNLNGNFKEFKLDDDFEFRKNVSKKEWTFYNYSNGSAFKGMVKYLRFDYHFFNRKEMKTVAGICRLQMEHIKNQHSKMEKVDVENIQGSVGKLKKFLEEQNEAAADDLAVSISKVLTDKIRELCGKEMFEEAEKLLHLCNVARRNSSIDSWNSMGHLFYEKYCSAMKNSDNRKAERIYNAWRWANRMEADVIQIVYTNFEYYFLRMDYKTAGNILSRSRKLPVKVRNILNEKLQLAKKQRQMYLARTFNQFVDSNSHWIAKEAIEAMEQADCPDNLISIFKKRLRRSGGAKNIKRAAIRNFIHMALANYDFLVERCVIAGVDTQDRMFVNGTEDKKALSVWEYMMRELKFSNRKSELEYVRLRRSRIIRCILVFFDKKHLSAKESGDLKNIPELADFVLKK